MLEVLLKGKAEAAEIAHLEPNGERIGRFPRSSRRWKAIR